MTKAVSYLHHCGNTSGIQGMLKETRGLFLGFSTVSYVTSFICESCAEKEWAPYRERKAENKYAEPEATEEGRHTVTLYKWLI